MHIAQTKDTLSDIYLASLKIRNQVFVKEQGVPLALEVDENEALAVHFVLYDDDNEAVATLRFLPISDHEVKLQRMAVPRCSSWFRLRQTTDRRCGSLHSKNKESKRSL